MNIIGNTPLVGLEKIERKYDLKARISAKLEFYNPSGSIKDRAALYMIKDAETRGILKSGSTIIEPTSGNMGIALAALGAAKGYAVIIVMPADMSEERRKIISFYGAKLVLTDPEKGMRGAVNRAEELKGQISDSVILGQFENPANPLAHYETTAPEIFSQTAGSIDIFAAGVGTGGTLSGCGEYFKRVKPEVRVYAVEPAGFPHKIQGIGAGFVPDTFNSSICGGVITVTDGQAYEFQREIARTEGLFVGISSGAALCACVALAKNPDNCGKNIVTVFPDGGDKYLSLIKCF